MITILCNGEELQLDSSMKLFEFIVFAGYKSGMYAVAVNREFIPSEAQSGYQLQDGDSVEIVSPMQGG